MTYPWRFFRSGGFLQVKIDSVVDLQHLGELDPKLWAALSCPVQGLEFDRRTLEYLDADADGRIRIDDVKRAVAWSLSVLSQPSVLLEGKALPLTAINQQHPEGQQLFASAKRMLQNLGKSDAHELSVDDTDDLAKIFPPHQLNGDGIITLELAQSEQLKQLVETLINLGLTKTDRSGAQGIDAETLEQFVQDATAWLDWQQQGLKFNSSFAAIYPIYSQLADKITDFFTRCQLAAYDTNAASALNPATDDYLALSRSLISTDALSQSLLPLAHVHADGHLPLRHGIHPSWQHALSQLQHSPLTGWAELERIDQTLWLAFVQTMQPYQDWLAQQPAEHGLHALSEELLQACIDAQTIAQARQLMQDDAAMATEADAILDVDKLVRYQAYLARLLQNFVNFSDFYHLERPAMFQTGRLYIDGRSCDLCLTVNDASRHAKLASQSGTYLLYMECTRAASAEHITVVAAMTAGDAGNLMVGRNGVFYDHQGRDWDATISQIVSNPISIQEAFFSPYRRIGRMITEQIQKFAATKDKELDNQSAAAVSSAPAASKPIVPFDAAKFAGIFAAIGLAIGAIGTAVATVVSSFLKLMWWQMPLAVLGVILFISGPAMILAWFKLRARNLAPLLDANGWAINTNAKISLAFGAKLTAMATIPLGATRRLIDPHEQKSRAGFWWICLGVFALLALLWLASRLLGWSHIIPSLK